MNQPTIEKTPAVLHRLQISRTTLYRLVQRGELKAPIKLGPRASGWLSTDINEFIEARIKASRPDEKVAA